MPTAAANPWLIKISPVVSDDRPCTFSKKSGIRKTLPKSTAPTAHISIFETEKV
jgi:hypothetical protein